MIIACSGSQEKWGGHLGVPSHLVPDRAGVPILHRTVAQAARLLGEDVHILAPIGDPRYQVPGAVTHGIGYAPSEYAASRPWWDDHGRTVLLLGDVWFTDEALQTVAGRTEREYRAFGRYGRSAVTGTPYGEIFAISWWPAQHKLLDRHLQTLHGLRAVGKSNRPPGWLLLRLIQNTPVTRHLVRSPWWVEVDDLTDDLDAAVDYDRHPSFGGTDASR